MTNKCHEGISLRDWFAGMAMQGLLFENAYTAEYMAEYAYELADLMLSNRYKEVNNSDPNA